MKKTTIKLGEMYKEKKKVTESNIDEFARFSGDYNSLHMNDNNAFGKRVAHGIITVSYISKILGTNLPGEGTVYLEQNSKFLKPILCGDEIIITITLSKIIKKEKGIVRLDNSVTNQDNEVVIEGYSIVKIPIELQIEED